MSVSSLDSEPSVDAIGDGTDVCCEQAAEVLSDLQPEASGLAGNVNPSNSAILLGGDTANRLSMEAVLRRGGFASQALPCVEDVMDELGRTGPELVLCLCSFSKSVRDVVEMEASLRRLRSLIRRTGLKTAVVVLTPPGPISDFRKLVKLLEFADDLVVLSRGFGDPLLMPRLVAVMRRCRHDREDRRALTEQETESCTIRFGPLRIDPCRYEVRVDGAQIDLSLTQFRIIHLLGRNPERVFSVDQIRDELRIHPHRGDVSVKTHIYQLRLKLGEYSRLLQTVRSVGYRLRLPTEE